MFQAMRTAAMICAVAIGGSVMTTQGYGYDRPAGSVHGSRSPVVALNGIVATSQPLAAQVGLDILKAGGNAIDAAVAVDATLGVVEPSNCGIGGDLFAIIWDAKTQKLYGLNASGRSPYAMNADVLKERGLDAIPAHGALGWSVPGCVDGWDQLLRRFGTKSLGELLAPAIRYAEAGFPVSEIISGDWVEDEAMIRERASMAATYLVDGHAPRMGEVFSNPALAATYRLLADGGRDAFYRGEIARRIVAYSEKMGGLFTMRDFEDHASTWVDPASTTYRGYTVWEIPPNGQGIAVLEMLNILEGFDVASLGHNSAEYLHLLIEAKKLAFADRARYYADPEMAEVPIAQLVGKEYGERQRARIDPNRAALVVPPGDPYVVASGDTVYLTVVDKDRNCVSLIQSIFWGWGSAEVPDNMGFALQNRGMSFSMDPEHPNFVQPHKRPFHTIIPAFVTKDGKPFFSFGVMGGDMQPQGHMQVLCNLIDHGMNVQEAGDAARFRHSGSAQPTGGDMTTGGQVTVESGVPAAVCEALKEKGHNVSVKAGGYGGYQGILVDPETGVLHGATEARKDGCAVGY
ncbi:MAG: gamma-glutamyltransferase [Armatimonadota bacterium]|nr:MAG: gamma-glutamyltransferase [Armatimonadota bacterium]